MINNTTLVGRLTKNPELRYTGSGIAVVSFTLAVERNYTNAQGEKETDYIMCQSWRAIAEIISKFAVKGSLVGITGNIQTRNYQNNEGRTIYITEVLVDKFQMLEPKSVTDGRRTQAGDSGGQQGNYSNTNTNSSGNNSYNSNNSSNNNYSNNNQSQQSSNPNTNNNTNTSNNDNPFANVGFGNGDPFQSNDDVTNISDEDLPF